ncbi:MAG TPA: UDP-glucuronic acid decarboxylase family protein, partial [Rubrobacter sp.]|nr:UDP-glucuronic acid decarboxylase family protein [Rubrobacter sp.]
GGAGFIGSYLCERLLAEGYRVVCMDDLSTGSFENVAPFLAREAAFEYVEHDVSTHIDVAGELDEVYHFASAASPADFARIPIEILKTGALGTHNSLGLARARGAHFMLASTSEVYGDPLVHPQHEDYRGNVSTTGIRSVYDEAKRYAEALTMAYHRHHRLDTRIVRIFNTFGPRMREDDGRMVPNFMRQALQGEPLSVYGEGTQTRTVQYVDDLIEGVIRLMKSDETRPVNIGNPVEYSVREVAGMIIELSGSPSEISHQPLPEDDPKQRCPDITRAREVLGWEPQTQAPEGLAKTIEWFASVAEARSKGLPATRGESY